MVEEQRRGQMTVAEAGKKGGEKVKEKYGPEHFSKIGRRGGETVARERGSEFYKAIGRKGGNTVKEKLGSDYYLGTLPTLYENLRPEPCHQPAKVFKAYRRLGVCETHASEILGPDWRDRADCRNGTWILR